MSGTYTDKSTGITYESDEYVDNQPKRGVQFKENEFRYEGDFDDFQRSGQGTFVGYDQSGAREVQYTGEFVEDKFEGPGEL